MRSSTMLFIVALTEAFGDVKVPKMFPKSFSTEVLDRSMFGGVLPGMFISSRGPNIDFVTFTKGKYSLQRHAVKQCSPCPGSGLDVCKLKMEYESGSPSSDLKWSHLFQLVSREQHLAQDVSKELQH